MSTEILTKENLKNPKFDPKGSEKTRSDPQFSNLDLNKVQKHTSSKNKSKICINTLNKNLRQKEIKEKFENRILLSLIVSALAVLFYVST